jgi:two-component system NtrC family sensor kinase
MSRTLSSVTPRFSPWELAAEAIAVKIRWFGLLVGYILVNTATQPASQPVILNAILALGVFYTLLDTWFGLRGKVFLGRYPLAISILEAVFIGLLCYFDRGLDSPFRYYYFLSLICAAIRHPVRITYATCLCHSLSLVILYLGSSPDQQHVGPLLLALVMLGWVAWACAALARLLKHVGEYLEQLNSTLQQHQVELEARIAERTSQLQEAQAHVLHQEKMAAFGLLAAGIAHEVGNPLTSVSSLVQLLRHQGKDPYTLNKLALIDGQLQRIRTTLRELVQFSRPASRQFGRVALEDVLGEALQIAKYYQRPGRRIVMPEIPRDLPPLFGVRDQLLQIFLNLILNAIDAVGPDGHIELDVRREGAERSEAETRPGGVRVTIRDDGCGVPPEHAGRLFQPYFTTKEHGTGLGLFITRKLVCDQGGTVDWNSVPGEGTAFTVFLPLTPPDNPCVLADERSIPGEVLS